MNDAQPCLLLVEPHSDTRAILVRLLRECGWRVVGTATGREALRLAAQVEFAAAIVDTALPDVEVEAISGRLQCLRDTPVIATTTAIARDLDRYRAMPFQRVLLKPYRLDELREALMASIRDRHACACA